MCIVLTKKKPTSRGCRSLRLDPDRGSPDTEGPVSVVNFYNHNLCTFSVVDRTYQLRGLLYVSLVNKTT